MIDGPGAVPDETIAAFRFGIDDDTAVLDRDCRRAGGVHWRCLVGFSTRISCGPSRGFVAKPATAAGLGPTWFQPPKIALEHPRKSWL